MFWKQKKQGLAESFAAIRQAVLASDLPAATKGKYVKTFLYLIEQDLGVAQEPPKRMRLDVKRLIFEEVDK